MSAVPQRFGVADLYPADLRERRFREIRSAVRSLLEHEALRLPTTPLVWIELSIRTELAKEIDAALSDASSLLTLRVEVDI